MPTTEAREYFSMLRTLIADPTGAEGIAFMLEEEGWTCTPPPSPQRKAAQVAADVTRKRRG